MKILIAEDDLVTRDLLKRILRHLADEIIEANDGIEALSLIESEDPDFLFTDIQMPGLDGRAVVEALRASAAHRGLPIVCMSAVRAKEEVISLVALGIQDFVAKPIRATEAQERFRRVISQHGGWRRRQAAAGRPIVLLVDPDADFRDRVRPLLEATCTVIDAPSAATALKLYKETDPRPVVVAVARGLPLIGEVQLAGLIGKLAATLQAPPPRLWLMSDDEVPTDVASHFQGSMRRHQDPGQLAEELERTLLQVAEGDSARAQAG
ncbi:MAG: response regulator [Gemmatimonadaceae bacterium]|nr:response regulator [Gemmatimonadaceae bacterium]